MHDRAFAADVAVDRHVVGWIAKHHRSQCPLHQARIARRLLRVCAEQPVGIEQPQIPGARHRKGCRRGRDVVGISCSLLVGHGQAFDSEIDLAHAKSGQFQTEVQVQFGELDEFPDRLASCHGIL